MPELHLGLMSGTSLDGVSAAVVDLTNDKIRPVAHATYPYPEQLRDNLISLVQPEWRGSLVEIQKLEVEVARFFVACSEQLLKDNDLNKGSLSAVGLHGQTICHTPEGDFASSWQLCDPNIISEHLGTTVVSDWRRRDMAAGGQGAPLTPAFHRFMISGDTSTAVLNLGGIANLTAFGDDWLGFDTGPANILIDTWIQHSKQLSYDDNGNWARSGNLNHDLLDKFLADEYFQKSPPKSTGREHFNLEWIHKHIDADDQADDIQATLTELTAKSAMQAIFRYTPDIRKLYLCGGGVDNIFLRERLQAQTEQIEIDTTAAIGVDPDYVEAIAFAWLAKNTIEGKSGNLPGTTGASGSRVLGSIYHK